MSDLDKLMNKLQSGTKKEETKPQTHDDDDDDEDVEEEVVEEKPKPTKKVEKKVEEVEQNDPIPADIQQEHSVEGEVGILQNNGIFRRELLLVLKEKNDIDKIIAQSLLDIRNKLIGDEDGS